MTALAEALLAAQRQAIGALSKAYVAGAFEDDGDAGLIANLDRIGATDAVDQSYLRECLDTLRTWGAPTNGTAPKRDVKPYFARLLAVAEAAREFTEINAQKSTNLTSEWNDAVGELHRAVARAANSQEPSS